MASSVVRNRCPVPPAARRPDGDTLTLNVLLSFAQFEREVTGERIRDKIAASKKKGMWMGGNVPLGYDASERTLAINPAEAETVSRIFVLYRELGGVRRVKQEADRIGLRRSTAQQRKAPSAAANCSPGGTSTGCSPTRFTPARLPTRASFIPACIRH